jgi:uncharacterized protein
MEPRITVITLAVHDLERTLSFYRDGLGFESPGIVGSELIDERTGAAGAIAMFGLQGGLILCVYPPSELARDAGVPSGPPKTGEFSLGHAVASQADVDAVVARAESAGATVLDKPHHRPWGIYSGYFQDLDGHLWEIEEIMIGG